MATTANLKLEPNFITTDGKIVLKEFYKPLNKNIFFKNKRYLIDNSKMVNFNKYNWRYNPQLYCLEEYDIAQLFPLILLVNDVRSIFEFTPEKMKSQIITPKKFAIIDIFSFPRL
jgi:hypothetical protein